MGAYEGQRALVVDKTQWPESSHAFDVNGVLSGYPEIPGWVDANQTKGRVVEVAAE